jgi:hypothetical protein
MFESLSFRFRKDFRASGSPGSTIPRLARVTAIDRAVVFAGIGNVAAALIGVVNALLVASIFSPLVQGMFYAFGSLTALSVFFEFGIGQTIIQFASHEWAVASNGNRDPGREAAQARLTALSRISVAWYSACGLLVIFGISMAGVILFDRRGDEITGWLGPWLLLCAGSALNVVMTPLFLFIQVYKPPSVFWLYRLVYQLVYGLSLLCGIYLGAGLWSVGVATCLGLLWSSIYVGRYVGVLRHVWTLPWSGWALWYRELWPLQWKIATTSLCSYFVNPLLVLIAFHLGGPVLAGQLGMSGTANIFVLAVATGWVVTRGPKFAVLVAQGKAGELNLLFARANRAMLAVAVGGGLSLWSIVYLLNAIDHPLAERLVGPLPMALLAFAMILQTASIGAVTYIRAHKTECLGLVSLLTLAVSVFGSAAVASRWGAVGIALVYLVAVGAIQMPTALWCLGRLRSRKVGQRTPEFAPSN